MAVIGNGVLLFVLAVPIVQLLFERGAFKPEATEKVSLTLMCLAPGLVAFSTVNILARAFYALGDTKTPMKISLVCLVLNFSLACWLMFWIKEGGPGVANTATSALNVYLLVHALRKKLGRLEMQELQKTLLPLAGTALVAGLLAWFLRNVCDTRFGHATVLARMADVFIPASIAGTFYIATALALKIPAAAEMTAFLTRRFRR